VQFNDYKHFDLFGRWLLHSEDGPVISIVEMLMNEANRSARLMALLSLQLSKLVTSSPVLMPFYADAYVKMLLYGSPLTDQPGTALEVGKVIAPFGVNDIVS
jgi:hypothetical protein